MWLGTGDITLWALAVPALNRSAIANNRPKQEPEETCRG